MSTVLPLEEQLMSRYANERVWVFGNGHGARLIWNWLAENALSNLSGLVCESNQSLGLESLAEAQLTAQDTVIVGSQYAEEIIKRLRLHHRGRIVDATALLRSLLSKSHGELTFAKADALSVPYPRAVYRRLLRDIKANAQFTHYSCQRLDTIKRRAFHRYDIDRAACCAHYTDMLDIAHDEGVFPSVFVRTDKEDYDPASLIASVKHYSSQGVEFGLHTSCYSLPNPIESLLKELETFERLYGFTAKSLTIHGLGSLYVQERIELGQYIIENLDSLGLDYADIPGKFRHHHYVIQDCHADELGNRYLKEDIMNIKSIVRNHLDVLLLVHPCYW